MTQQPACVPPEGAEDASSHWVQHSSGLSTVWRWRILSNAGWCLPGTNEQTLPQDAYAAGWRYSHPASPTDATDLAAARAENAKLAAEVKDAWDTMDGLGNQCREKDAAIATLNERICEMEAAIRWALGEGDSDFGNNVPDGAPRYWWRTELGKRAALDQSARAGRE